MEKKKSGACTLIFAIVLFWILVSMIPAQIMAGRMVSAQRSQCAMIKEGLYQFSGNYPQPGQYVPKTEEECLNMVNQASFMPRLIFSGGAVIAAAFLTAISLFVLANLPSSSSAEEEKEESSGTDEMENYGKHSLIAHMRAAGMSDEKIEERLNGMTDDLLRQHLVEQYLESLPNEDRDAAAKRLKK